MRFNSWRPGIAGLLSSAMAISLAIAPNAGAAEPTVSPQRYALLIGIDEYVAPGVPKLRGCKNDVGNIRELLVREFQFPNDDNHVKLLLDGAATKDAIIRTFRSQLVANAKKYPGGIFYLHYSGHGSRRVDTTGLEEDGYDETVVPVDSRIDDQHIDLIDKEIATLLAELTKYTSNVVVTLDSCHSGNATRDVDSTSREAPADDRPQAPLSIAVPKPEPGETRELESDNGLFPRSDRYVAISACAPTETAQETKDQDRSKRNGLLTRNLVKALLASKPGTTYRQLWGTLQTQMAADTQHPQMEGDLDRVIFGLPANRSDPYMAVASVNGRTITLQGGSAQGITDGSMMAVYKPDALKLQGEGELLCKGTVTKVDALTSEVLLNKDLDPSTAKSAKVVVISPKFAATPLKVALQTGGASNDDWKRVSDAIAASGTGNPLFAISEKVNNPFERGTHNFDVAIIHDTYAQFSKGQAKLNNTNAPSDGTQVCFVTNSAGTPLFNFYVRCSDEDAAQKVLSVIEKKSKQDFVRRLENKVSNLDGSLKLTVVRVTGSKIVDGKKVPIENLSPADQLGTAHFKPGEQFLVKIDNKSKSPVYVNMISLGTSGNIHVVYSSKAKALAPGASIKTPAMAISPPLGLESLKVIGTTSPADFSVLTQSGATTRSLDDLKGPSGNSPLQSLIGQAVCQTRDTVVQDADDVNVDDWTATRLDYEIYQPQSMLANKSADK